MHDDWLEEIIPRLENSYIYKKLIDSRNRDSASDHAIALVKDAVSYAYQRTKTIVRHMGEFTLHDAEHLFRVLQLMERILSHEVIDKLSTPELLLLILTAFFHDIGMSPDEKAVLAWKKKWDYNPEFKSQKEVEEYNSFQRFCSARPERLQEIDNQIIKGNTTLAETLKNYFISDYIRSTHGERSIAIIGTDWNNKIKYRDTDLTVEFADICLSHTDDAFKVMLFDKRYICGPDVFACLPLIAIVLRIADIVDFDMKRTPTILFSHLAVRNPVSLKEWQKHRSIEAWEINQNIIQFQAKCSHPAIEASIHSFCDLIDRELSICNNILNEINYFNILKGRDLTIKIPFKVDRDRIKTKKDISGKPLYNYRETHFDLSKNQVIDLLMGTKLYGNSEVALRELLQNSIDACLLRKALEDKWHNNYEPKIQVKYYKFNSEDILEVTDNGIGMDQYIIDNYYSRIGSSFYKSTDFYNLQSQTNADFIPTSRFGIGILSCFMVADTILVDTRKLYEPHKSSDPISLVIEGQDSIFWVKDGKRETPGTETKLILRKNKNPWENLNEDQFIKSLEHVIPNPPFAINVTTESYETVRDNNSFKEIFAASLKDYSWDEHENIKEFEFVIDSLEEGIIGSAIVGILESHGMPVVEIDMTSKEIDIEGKFYLLEKKMKLSDNKIELYSTSISIDDGGDVQSSSSWRPIAKSNSRIALHGIEVPSTLFPDSWTMRKDQVKISWPFPILIIVDVCGRRDLDLNSARDRIILSDNWMRFEEDLAKIICQNISKLASPDYWQKLIEIFNESHNDAFLRGFRQALSII